MGLLRLRKCSEEGTFRPELVRKEGEEGGCSIVRELHVYGTAVPVHGRDPTKFQHQVCRNSEKIHQHLTIPHKGFGTLLMEEAERIAREEHGSVKLAVISGAAFHSVSQCRLLGLISFDFAFLGVGTRDYYRKLGYELDGPYMSRRLV